MTGVYIIINKANGKFYIGSTSKSFKYRWGLHKSELRRGIHKNKHLQNAWNKYQEESFSFQILEICEPSKCLITEQYWIDYYVPYKRNIGYNINKLAKSRLGMTTGLGSGSRVCKNVSVYTTEGNLVGKYLTGAHASFILFQDKKYHKLISECVSGRKKSFRGLVFTTNNKFPGYIKQYTGRGQWSEFSKNKASTTRTGIARPYIYKAVTQRTKNGIVLQQWESINLAAITLDIKATNIVAALKGKRLSAGGYLWTYL